MSMLAGGKPTKRAKRRGTARAFRGRRHTRNAAFTGLALGASFAMLAIGLLASASGAVAVSGFRLEFQAVVVVSLLLGVLAYTVESSLVFRALVIAQLGLAMIAVRMLGPESAVLSLFFAVPLVVEIGLFDSGRWRTTLLSGTLASLLAVLVLDPRNTRSLAEAQVIAVFAVGSLSAVAAVLAVDRYREELVRCTAMYRSSQETISNLSEANQAFQMYADAIEDESAERERNRITGELHDSVGYALTNVAVMMKAARIRLKEDPGSVDQMLEQVEKQSVEALQDVRQILHQMRSFTRPAPEGYAAIFSLAKAFEGATRIRVEVHRGNIPSSLGSRLDLILYRAAQEALTNAFRHGEATRVAIHLWKSDSDITMVVKDNGRGSGAGADEPDGMGLAGIRERLKPVGGECRAGPVPGGFELFIRVPYGIGRLGGASESVDR